MKRKKKAKEIMEMKKIIKKLFIRFLHVCLVIQIQQINLGEQLKKMELVSLMILQIKHFKKLKI